jgi:hypothetical protein
MTQEKSDHFDGRRFVNPAGAAGQSFSAVARMLSHCSKIRWSTIAGGGGPASGGGFTLNGTVGQPGASRLVMGAQKGHLFKSHQIGCIPTSTV